MILSNNPPSQIEFTQETAKDLNNWLTDHPGIKTDENAREGKLLIDRASACLGDLEAERDSKVRPLNEQVKTINDAYRGPRLLLETVASELRRRIEAFVKAEEAKRAEEARKAQEALEEAERKAIEAELALEAAAEDASAGVVVDIGAATGEAEAAFRAASKASREAARAEQAQHVKIGGGFRKALSLRSKETLLVVDGWKAIDKLGFTEGIIDAIIKSARAYRQLRGVLPPGIESIKDRSL